jgi:hypothetical protein
MSSPCRRNCSNAAVFRVVPIATVSVAGKWSQGIWRVMFFQLIYRTRPRDTESIAARRVSVARSESALVRAPAQIGFALRICRARYPNSGKPCRYADYRHPRPQGLVRLGRRRRGRGQIGKQQLDRPHRISALRFRYSGNLDYLHLHQRRQLLRQRRQADDRCRSRGCLLQVLTKDDCHIAVPVLGNGAGTVAMYWRARPIEDFARSLRRLHDFLLR